MNTNYTAGSPEPSILQPFLTISRSLGADAPLGPILQRMKQGTVRPNSLCRKAPRGGNARAQSHVWCSPGQVGSWRGGRQRLFWLIVKTVMVSIVQSTDHLSHIEFILQRYKVTGECGGRPSGIVYRLPSVTRESRVSLFFCLQPEHAPVLLVLSALSRSQPLLRPRAVLELRFVYKEGYVRFCRAGDVWFRVSDRTFLLINTLSVLQNTLQTMFCKMSPAHPVQSLLTKAVERPSFASVAWGGLGGMPVSRSSKLPSLPTP